MADYGRVAGDSGKAIVTGTDAGRVAGESGQAIVTPDAEFRVALMFVEVFVELYEVPLQAPGIQGEGLRRGLEVTRKRR